MSSNRVVRFYLYFHDYNIQGEQIVRGASIYKLYVASKPDRYNINSVNIFFDQPSLLIQYNFNETFLFFEILEENIDFDWSTFTLVCSNILNIVSLNTVLLS